MKKLIDLHIENDKILAPFLLAASFNGLLMFQGSFKDNGVLYWRFSPKDISQKLTEDFYMKREPHLPARDLFEAIDTFWKQIYEMKGRQ